MKQILIITIDILGVTFFTLLISAGQIMDLILGELL